MLFDNNEFKTFCDNTREGWVVTFNYIWPYKGEICIYYNNTEEEAVKIYNELKEHPYIILGPIPVGIENIKPPITVNEYLTTTGDN